jgi:hypothetical protein
MPIRRVAAPTAADHDPDDQDRHAQAEHPEGDDAL